MMTAEDLKYSILLMAMQGKLVEQRAEEGTGEDLYKIILEERQRLVKGGKIKKEKEQKEKTEDAPFDIPESWKWARLNDIVSKTIKRGKSPRYAQKSNTLVFAQKCNTKAGIIDLSLCLFLDDNHLSKYSEEEFMLDKDIVINSTGNGTLGRVNIYRDTDNPQGIPIVPDSHVTVIRCNRHMDVGYVFHCLKYYQPYMEKLGSGSTNQTELGAGIIKELAFPIPPLEEQKRIAAKIEELMPFVEQYAAASTKLNTLNATFPEMMKKSILQEAVQGKLVPQDPNDEPASVLLKKIAEEKKRLIKEGKIKKEKQIDPPINDDIPFDIPESWEWSRFGSITYNRDSERIPLSVSERTKLKKVYDYYGASGVIDKVEEYLFDKSLLLIGEDGANLLNRSTPIAFIAKGKYWVNNHAHVIDMSPLLDMSYIAYYINSISLAKYVTGTAQPKMNQAKMNSIWVPIPPLNEQKRIVARIEQLLPIVNEL